MANGMLQSLLITAREATLVDVIRDLKYGEIVEYFADGEKKIDKLLSGVEKKLIDTVREYPEVENITFHQGQPTAATVRGDRQGVKYIQKIKFN